MYTKYFGLNKPPFKITPDPEFFFAGGNRGAVLDALLYAVARGEGIVKVVGEVGSGKTMLCRMLERELPRDCEIVYIANPRLSPAEILDAIAIELELEGSKGASKVEVMRLLHAYLLDKHAHGRRVVMFIEEAQGMDLDTLEEIRMLSNLETTQDKLLQIVLFGQPELNDKLCAHEIRQLRERITYSFDLKPLDRSEIRDYVNTRIRASGFRGNDLLSNAAIRSLEKHSAGLLRRINILADKALLAAFSRGDRVVGATHVRLAARDSEFNPHAGKRPQWLFRWGLIAVCGAVLMLTWAWQTNSVRTAREARAGVPDAGVAEVMPHVPANSANAVTKDSQNRHSSSPLQSLAENSDISREIEVNNEATGNLPLLAAHLLDLEDVEPDTSPVLRTDSLIEFLE